MDRIQLFQFRIFKLHRKAELSSMKGKGLEPMISQIKTILFILFILSAAAVSPAWSVEVGEQAPDFSMQTFDGGISSRASLEGRPLLLVFWNTWCPTCMVELPHINRLAERLVPRGLTFLAVNTAINDSEKRARAYWIQQGYVFPSGFDHSFEIGEAFGLRGVPTVFLIDSKGVVHYKDAVAPANLEARFEQLAGKAQQFLLQPPAPH